MTARRRRWPFDLYVLTDRGAARGDDVYLEALASADPGLAVQVRDAGASLPDVARRLAALQPTARRHARPLLVGVPDRGRLTLARDALVDGVHLPERGPSVAEVRAVLGSGAWVGASVHDATGLARRMAEGVDFVVVGPVGPVPGKGAPLSDEALADLVHAAGEVPVLALGGIRSADDVARVVGLGAAGVAVLSRVAEHGDGAEAVRTVRRWLDDAKARVRFRDLSRASR
ncbi:MAG: hypothetical protein OHK0013_48160 [Sandaracinaceae bacterium]